MKKFGLGVVLAVVGVHGSSPIAGGARSWSGGLAA